VPFLAAGSRCARLAATACAGRPLDVTLAGPAVLSWVEDQNGHQLHGPSGIVAAAGLAVRLRAVLPRAIYYLEPSSLLSQRVADSPGLGDSPFFASTAPSWPYLTWAGIWLAGVLVLSLVSFQRREL
jgi:hypothetical protein